MLRHLRGARSRRCGGGGRVLLACSEWFFDLQPTLLAAAEAEGLVLRSREDAAATRGGEQRPVVLEFGRA